LEQMNMVREEVRILRMLKHPNIMKIYEYYEEGGYMYLICELC
jgi:serine/threonine protein kinase